MNKRFSGILKTYLKRQLILILIHEQPHFRDDIAQVVLNKFNGFVKPRSHSFLITVGLLLDVVTVSENLKVC
jgi:hypothetical protein